MAKSLSSKTLQDSKTGSLKKYPVVAQNDGVEWLPRSCDLPVLDKIICVIRTLISTDPELKVEIIRE